MLVVGAGVSGLTTAICLAEAGVRAVIQAAVPPAQTTSSVAGAIWGPHLVEESPRSARWRRGTLAVLRGLADEAGTGVRVVTGVDAARGEPPPLGPPPDWLRDLGTATPCTRDSLPPGFTSGWRYAAPLVHMPTYLGYLQARFEKGRRAGGDRDRALAHRRGPRARRPRRGELHRAGARDLVPDPALTAFRGQVVVAANPGITGFFIGPPDDTADLVYLFPHGDTVILGGTEVAGDWSREPDPATAKRILADCTQLEPQLRDATVLEHRVGLRPSRSRVRLEAEARGRVTVVHNYGHGGSGVTLSWGCAEDAAALVLAALG